MHEQTFPITEHFALRRRIPLAQHQPQKLPAALQTDNLLADKKHLELILTTFQPPDCPRVQAVDGCEATATHMSVQAAANNFYFWEFWHKIS
ncbi:hypothetical protein GCM10009621_19730 [Corynebacterium felinum]